jgi:hypothetical protein
VKTRSDPLVAADFSRASCWKSRCRPKGRRYENRINSIGLKPHPCARAYGVRDAGACTQATRSHGGPRGLQEKRRYGRSAQVLWLVTHRWSPFTAFLAGSPTRRIAKAGSSSRRPALPGPGSPCRQFRHVRRGIPRAAAPACRSMWPLASARPSWPFAMDQLEGHWLRFRAARRDKRFRFERDGMRSWRRAS